MSELQLSNRAGVKQTFSDVRKLTAENLSTETRAALRDGKDNVLVAVEGDVYLASGMLAKDFRPESATFDGKAGAIKGVQLEKDEPTTFWRKLKLGMNFPAVQAGAGSALVGMLGGAWVAGTFFGGAMPVMWGIAGGLAVLGFLGAAYAQGATQTELPMPDVTRWVAKKVQQ